MKDKTRTIFLMSVMSALAVSLTAASLSYAFTDARYVGGGFDPDSPYDDVIDFVGATKYIVSSPEELVNAIENGYSYIQIDKDAADPFVINSDIADVVTNLVLDVNGKVVVRNSRNPLLDVKRNVSVVLVYDSSQQQTGGFYNPIGSALQASGGTLTVGTGIYESGPRSDTAAPSAQLESVDYVYSRTARTNDASYEQVTDVKLPKIDKDAYYASAPSAGSEYIKEDTYLLYTVETDCEIRDGKLIANVSTGGDELRVPCNVASCDFYYYYPVGASSEGGQNYAVVYGYHDVKKLAETEDRDLTEASGGVQLVWPYAAVRSTAGNTYARGGDFATHFGTKNTYGIYSYGGTIAVGGEAGSAEPEFRAYGDGVCINMEAEAGNADVTSTLTIVSGVFSSEEGDTVSISGGKMTVYAGTFSKTGCRAAAADEDRPQAHTAVIRMQGGELSIRGSEEDKVVLRAGSETSPETSPLENVFGIRAGEGTVSVSGCKIDVYGVYSAGVLSYNGEVNLQDTSIQMTQKNEGLLSSAGVSSERDESDSIGEGKPINMNGDVSIVSDGLGVTARGTVNVKGGTTTVTTTRGTGIYVNYGAFNVDKTAAVSVESTIEDIEWAMPPEHPDESGANRYNGVYVQSGSLIAKGSLSVTHKGVKNVLSDYDSPSTDFINFLVNSYAVRVDGSAGTSVSIASGTIKNSIGGGLYVSGPAYKPTSIDASVLKDVTFESLGNITNNYADYTVVDIGNVTVEATAGRPDVKNEFSENYSGFNGNWSYKFSTLGGHAVEVDGGILRIKDGSYTAAQGDGIRVQDGVAFIEGGSFVGQDQYNNIDGGEMPGAAASYGFKIYGGAAKTTGGTFRGAFVMDGIAYIQKATIETVGSTGFGVWSTGYNTNILFDPIDDEGKIQNEWIKVSGSSTGMAIENGGMNPHPEFTVKIRGGTFTGGTEGTANNNTNGIWYGNQNAKMTISGGTFTGETRSGLWLGVDPGSNIKLSGGTFIGKSVKKETWLRYYWINGAIGANSDGPNSGLGSDILITDFIENKSTIQCFTNEILVREITVGDSSERDENKINQTTCRYNKVVILPPSS